MYYKERGGNKVKLNAFTRNDYVGFAKDINDTDLSDRFCNRDNHFMFGEIKFKLNALD